MALFSSTQPSLRANVVVKFPAEVVAGTGIIITKAGRIYTLAVDPASFVYPLYAVSGGLLMTDVKLVNFNSANTDTPFSIILPEGLGRWRLGSVFISNASASLTTATVGAFSEAAGAGVPLITSGTPCSVSTAAENTVSNLQAIGQSTVVAFNLSTVYFRVQTPQGSAATAKVRLSYTPVS